tara:strand:+ start:6202 stop:6456 length:255 start_codon:yes stop_codon:yes gene_type:complete
MECIPDVREGLDATGKHWIVTNTTGGYIEVDCVTDMGTLVVVPLALGASFRFYPATKDDCNVRARFIQTPPQIALFKSSNEDDS